MPQCEIDIAQPVQGFPMIDTRAPLLLSSSEIISLKITFTNESTDNSFVVQDLLAVHVVRKAKGTSSIFTYHPEFNIPTTTAKTLQDRILYAGNGNRVILGHNLTV